MHMCKLAFVGMRDKVRGILFRLCNTLSSLKTKYPRERTILFLVICLQTIFVSLTIQLNYIYSRSLNYSKILCLFKYCKPILNQFLFACEKCSRGSQEPRRQEYFSPRSIPFV